MTKLHPLVDPKQSGATAESNLEDMDRIRGLDGDERQEAIDMMVVANIPLVVNKVDGYVSLFPTVEFMYDDLISEGLLALTDAVNKLAGRETPEDGGNVTAFISQRIVWRLGDLISNDEKQRVPYDYVPPVPDIIDPMEIVDTRDLLDSICETEEDRIILEMREKGCKDKEIADRLDISRWAAYYRRNELGKRYQARLAEVQ